MRAPEERVKERGTHSASQNYLAQAHSHNHCALDVHGTTCAANEARRREDVVLDAERASWRGEISQTAAFGTREVTVMFSRCLVGPGREWLQVRRVRCGANHPAQALAQINKAPRGLVLQYARPMAMESPVQVNHDASWPRCRLQTGDR